jgi:hypothetical protein
LASRAISMSLPTVIFFSSCDVIVHIGKLHLPAGISIWLPAI